MSVQKGAWREGGSCPLQRTIVLAAKDLPTPAARPQRHRTRSGRDGATGPICYMVSTYTSPWYAWPILIDGQSYFDLSNPVVPPLCIDPPRARANAHLCVINYVVGVYRPEKR